MPKSTQAETTDPLEAFLNRRRRGSPSPVPLVATSIEVDVEGGIAVVSTRRVFRNLEDDPIEATMTFPVPVHATLFSLETWIGERRLTARAQGRAAARETYEDAVGDGLTAVLHEEVLRGVHMLSVAPLAPGAEVIVEARWVGTFALVGDRGELRVPMTVREIYGRTPLPDTDDLLTGGAPATAELTLRSEEPIEVLGATLSGGKAKVLTNAPIDLVMAGLRPVGVPGITATGQPITVTLSKATGPRGGLDLAVLVDRSGSMDSPASGGADAGSGTAHQATVAALANMAAGLGAFDHIDLWEFDDAIEHVGAARGSGLREGTMRDRFRALVGALGAPRGGTQVGAALSRVLADSPARDLLLITDGRSHALDVHALARRGRRISVVLVGADSLDANVGHLAALTGGELFVAMGGDVAPAVEAAFRALRGPWARVEYDPATRSPARERGGAEILVEDARRCPPRPMTRAVGALAASLRLPALPADLAAAVAEREGLVTHLTSLVLVDEDGVAVEGLPAPRKVALPYPGSSSTQMSAFRAFNPWTSSPRRLMISTDLEPPAPAPSHRSGGALADLATRIGWDEAATTLARGDLSALPAEIAKTLLRMAGLAPVAELALRLDRDPLMLVIGRLALLAKPDSRSARRVARLIFQDLAPGTLDRELPELDARLRETCAAATATR